MRKKIDRVIFAFARTGLILTMILCLLSAVAAIITVSFNLNGQFWLSKNSYTRLSEFGPGIPFHTTLGIEIPDTSIVIQKAGARSLYNYYSIDRTREQMGKQLSSDSNYSDTIVSDFKIYNGRSESKDIKLIGVRLNKAVFYVQADKVLDRLVLSLPRILPLLLIAFCSWQLLQLLRAIHSGSAFSQSSPKRIARIGWAILFGAILMFILDLLQNSVTTIWWNFSSTIPNYRLPFEASAHKEGFTQVDWLIGGAIILLIAKAFSYGNQLQKYEDETI